MESRPPGLDLLEMFGVDMQLFGCIWFGAMDAVFRALADESRRKLLDRLHEENGRTLNELCRDMGMTRQAVSKHLGLLEEANLVTTVKQGREKLHYLNPVPIQQIYMRWIGKFEQSRVEALHNLKEALEASETRQEKKGK